MYEIDIMTLFPDAVDMMLSTSIIGRAQKRGLVTIRTHQIRDYTSNRQMQVDDYPYGGGRGCVMQVQPLADCWKHICEERGKRVHTIYMSPCGKKFVEDDARRLRDDYEGFILVCGHYEGVDERFIEECVDEEISLGDFVLTGGEIPAMAVADAVCRLVPGVLPDEECYTEESHWSGLLEYPQYSRPDTWNGMSVPSVLLSGNHSEIRKWRFRQSLTRTMERRPDMYSKLDFKTHPEQKMLAEFQRNMEDERLEKLIDKYAELAIKTGINVRPGQTLLITAPVDAADFTRLCVKKAYEAGAREVEVRWHDDAVARETYLRGADDIFDTVKPWKAEQVNTLSAEGAAFLTIYSEDPEAMSGVDPDRIRRLSVASGKATAEFRERQMSDKVQWCIVSVPNVPWAKTMFPNMNTEKAVRRQWEAILATARVSEDNDPQADWAEHITSMQERVKILNDYNFRLLKYTNSLGTDLTVRLPDGHFWAGANSKTPEGVEFTPNIPTEEIFTAPLLNGVDGTVYASKPLVLNGAIVDNFWFVLQAGEIVEVHAERGEEHLRNAIAIDEGARRLGEVALVPYDSPISRSGLLFYNTLFDENASCHLAFGAAYPCVRGAEELTPEERLKLGLNDSMTHVDFMVGTRDLEIVGVTNSGEEIQVFRDGNFAF